MKEILTKLGIDISLQGDALRVKLETGKQIALRRYNSVFGNLAKEVEISLRIKMIEEAQKLLVEDSIETDAQSISTGLVAKKASFNIDDISFTPQISKPGDETEGENAEAYDCVVQGSEAYNNGDFDKAFKHFLEAAEKGYVSAMCTVGSMYDNGLGTNTDPAKAFEWHKKAVEKGSFDSMHKLGQMYWKGQENLERNDMEAHKWFLKAAEGGRRCHAMFGGDV